MAERRLTLRVARCRFGPIDTSCGPPKGLIDDAQVAPESDRRAHRPLRRPTTLWVTAPTTLQGPIENEIGDSFVRGQLW